MFDYPAYQACFNSGDDDALVDRFFDDDVVFTGGTRAHRGKEALRAFLRWAHDGVREVMRPQVVLQDAEHLFAEIDMDFHATAERADFPFGALWPGDSVTVKFFVTYRLRNGRIVELKSMTWPPGQGVTTLPLLGAHPSQVAAFHSYVSAFSNADTGRFTRFYHPEITLQLNATLPPLVGPEGIAGFYDKMFATVRERLTIHSLAASDDAVRIAATARFTAVNDAPDFVLGALAQGDFMEARMAIDYVLCDGLIRQISVKRETAFETVRQREQI